MTNAVRPAQPADRSAVENIVYQAYEPWVQVIGTRPAPMDADYGSLIATGSVYVTGSGDLDGLIVAIPEPSALLVENVAVRPARQQRGVGQSLLAFAETTAQHHELPAVRLYTHAKMTSNIRLYQQLGYLITERQPIDTGHLVHLRKQVGPGTVSAPHQQPRERLPARENPQRHPPTSPIGH